MSEQLPDYFQLFLSNVSLARGPWELILLAAHYVEQAKSILLPEAIEPPADRFPVGAQSSTQFIAKYFVPHTPTVSFSLLNKFISEDH